MKSTSDKPSSSRGGADVSDSWSAAFIADYENNNDNIPPGDNEEKKMEVQVAINTSPRKESSCSIRNANKPMEVFMSARFCRRIECLLAGNIFEEEEEEDDDVNLYNDDGEEDVILSYVHQCIVSCTKGLSSGDEGNEFQYAKCGSR